MASREELEEGRKQMEEAEKRMSAEGIEVVDRRGGRPGSDGQFLGSVSSGEELRNPVGRPESFAPSSRRTVFCLRLRKRSMREHRVEWVM